MSTLNAPNGVTRIAGAKAYAAKLATSPITTRVSQSQYSEYSVVVKFIGGFVLVTMPAHHIGFVKYEYPSPSKPRFFAVSMRP